MVDVDKVLKSTVKNKPYTLYRGMGLVKQKVKDLEKRKILNNLEVGDAVPLFLLKDLKPHTKKKGIARYYIEGDLSIIYKLDKINPNNIPATIDYIKGIMKKHNVDPVGVMMQQALDNGVKMIACNMSMELLGIQHDELLDGVELGGVAMYIGAASESNSNLFI